MTLATELSKRSRGIICCPAYGCPIQRTTEDPNASTLLDGMAAHVERVHPDLTLSKVLAS